MVMMRRRHQRRGDSVASIRQPSGQGEKCARQPKGVRYPALTTGGYDLLPLWSPDGARVAFMSLRKAPARGAYQIWVVNADGTNLTQVTANATANEYPVWSPDSSQIAYSQFANTGWRVVKKSANGTGA